MKSIHDIFGFQLIYVIVNYGLGSKVLQSAKKMGISGGTVFHGKGTVDSALLKFLSLYEERKEIVLLGAEEDIAKEVMRKLDDRYHFDKPHHGIMFSIPAFDVYGSNFNVRHEGIEREVEKAMYQIIITVVNRGLAEDVIDAAKEKGSKGGTIINARGSGIHETVKLFNMDIEPEKEIVLILTPREDMRGIVDNIRKKLSLDEPGNGIIFVQDVAETYGIYR